jgi:hypothetical protein
MPEKRPSVPERYDTGECPTCERLRETLAVMLADVQRTESGMRAHSEHGQMVARAMLADRLSEALRNAR